MRSYQDRKPTPNDVVPAFDVKFRDNNEVDDVDENLQQRVPKNCLFQIRWQPIAVGVVRYACVFSMPQDIWFKV